ncbi:MAG: hypothetical protein RJQ14_13495 [Marinoscillum sp.]
MFLCLSFFTSFAQILKKRKKVSDTYIEEYTVLKENKKLKHGDYLKFRNDLNKSIAQIGQYERGEKTGIWYEFTPSGYLRSEGFYSKNIKQGLWRFYYEPIRIDPNIFTVLTSNKGIYFHEDGTIEIERECLIVSSEGVFHSGEKTGGWNYYSLEGQLLHKFDHTLQELKVNNAPDSLNYAFPFLGGLDQFYKLFFQIIYDETRSLYPSNAQVKIRLNTKEFPISMELVESNGHEEFPKVLIELLRRMEENFLAEFNEDKNGILYFIGESKFYENRSTYTLRFEKQKGSNE